MIPVKIACRMTCSGLAGVRWVLVDADAADDAAGLSAVDTETPGTPAAAPPATPEAARRPDDPPIRSGLPILKAAALLAGVAAALWSAGPALGDWPWLPLAPPSPAEPPALRHGSPHPATATPGTPPSPAPAGRSVGTPDAAPAVVTPPAPADPTQPEGQQLTLANPPTGAVALPPAATATTR